MSEMPVTNKVRISKPNSAQQGFIGSFVMGLFFFSNAFSKGQQPTSGPPPTTFDCRKSQSNSMDEQITSEQFTLSATKPGPFNT